MRRFLVVAMLAVMMCFLTASAQANLLVNGSFEQGTDYARVYICSDFMTLKAGQTNLTGWTILGHSIDWKGTYWEPAPDSGSKSIDLNGNGKGGVSQLFSTVPGTQYIVSFYMAGNPDGAPKGKTMALVLDWATTTTTTMRTYNFDTTSTKHLKMGWELNTFQFFASGTQTELQFLSKDEGSYGAAIDGVDVSAVPIPGALILFGSGFLGLVGFSRMRYRK